MTKPLIKVAVWKFTSCDGCQLSLLDCEDELLAVAANVDISYFMEATSRQMPGPYDLSIVEGSITTEEQITLAEKVRDQSRFLLTIGACATTGGIQALRNTQNVNDYIQIVYAHPEYINTLQTSTPISEHVPVDMELHGCPINKHQLLEVISALLNQRRPQISAHSVCMECKINGTVCLATAAGAACMGPITHAGCGALCPSYHRACFGCYGPKENANPQGLSAWHLQQGIDSIKIVENLQNVNAGAPAFLAAADHLIHQGTRRERQ